MPVFFNDGIDDPLSYDLCGTFVGGQVSNVRANLLKPEQYSEARNMDIDRFGSIITRRGAELMGASLSSSIQGLVYYDTPSLEKLITVANGVVYESTGGSWSSMSGYSPNSTAKVEMAQLIDKLYFTDEGNSNVHSLNGSTFTDEGSGGTNDPPKCKFLINHTSRLFAANTSDYNDEVMASDILGADTWASAFKFRIGYGEGDPITGIVSWYNHNLLVFKEHSIHVVDANPGDAAATAWSVHRIDNTVGCVANRTIAQAGSDVFFLARDGVRTVRTILAGAQSSVSEPISTQIGDIIDRINWSYVKSSSGIFWNNRYILSIPVDSSTTSNYTIVFNTVTRTWSGYWDGWTPTQYTTTAFNGFPKMVFGDSSGNILTWLDYVSKSNETLTTFQDKGTDVPSHISSRGLTFSDFFSPKLGNNVEFELETSDAGCHCIEVRSIVDTETEKVIHPSNIDTRLSGITLAVNLPFTLPSIEPLIRAYNMIPTGEFNELQFKVKSSSGKLHLRSIKASAFVNSIKLEKVS
jgi:hypothetical protein